MERSSDGKRGVETGSSSQSLEDAWSHFVEKLYSRLLFLIDRTENSLVLLERTASEASSVKGRPKKKEETKKGLYVFSREKDCDKPEGVYVQRMKKRIEPGDSDEYV